MLFVGLSCFSSMLETTKIQNMLIYSLIAFDEIVNFLTSRHPVTALCECVCCKVWPNLAVMPHLSFCMFLHNVSHLLQ